MALSDTQVQHLIVARVGDVDPATGDPAATLTAGVVWQHMNDLWDGYANVAAISPGLRELYVRRDAIDLVIATISGRVDFTASANLSIRRHQQIDTRLKQREAVEMEIERVEKFALAQRVPAMGQLTTVEPVSPPFPLGPNANSPTYSGSPYSPSRLP